MIATRILPNYNAETMNPEILEEMKWCTSRNFKLGEYIYMGMALLKGKRVCISVGYKIDYCIKKALQFQELNEEIYFSHINKIKIGELERCKKIQWESETI